MTMDFQSAMETFAEAWVAANTKSAPLTDLNPQSHAIALTRNCKTPPPASTPAASHLSGRDSTESVCTPVPPRSTNSIESAVSSPSAKEEFDHAKSGSSKSLPVHCIVESISIIEESKVSQPWRKRCLVETDSYVIIPVGTPFQGLVQAALLRLGYSAECATTAKGLVVIKNWKGLNFEQISDDPLITVGDILGELTAVATLRIQIIKNRNAAFGDIKDKLLHFFLTQSQGLLNSTGCPLDEICRTGNAPQSPDISDDCRRKFDQWWKSQFNSQSPSNKSYSGVQFPNQYPANAHSQKPFDRNLIDPLHSVMQTVQNQFPTQKTRMRTSFDPELELPKLQRWFADNQHPSRQQIQQYVKELNSLESRRGRKPLDVNNVVYWFKNARAAQKRAEIRSIGPGLNCHIPVNGFADHGSTNGTNILLGEPYLGHARPDNHLKGNIPEYYRRAFQATRMSDELSNATSEMEEDDVPESQPQSPVAPLSLTKSCRKDYKGDDESSHPGNSPPTPDIQVQLPTTEIKEEPVNLHSPQDQQSMSQKEATSDREDNGEGGDKSRIQSLNTSQAVERPLSQSYRTSPEYESQLPQRCNDSLERLTAGFPLVPNSMFSQSIMYMSHYIPGVSHPTPSPPSSSNVLGLTADERRKRNRTFIDPVTEVPRLEQWFSLNTHPSHNLILKYTEELNCMAYRQKFPRLEPKNVQFWFKNRRAKCKRLKMSLFDAQTSPAYHHGDRE
ncbi:uncharacterized protein LOC108738187 isoform X2 [Agrilus planipennis]|uniref:Uncharacterized protein LOC108738187 isoform X2 n=1 Tax=Agrilus planipennis TaxID=224129 RepID=A0A1W4X3R2_AGRPL|nr:uncharacterized protein LOC108738187 isoform X2 [Agrilus planipennis]